MHLSDREAYLSVDVESTGPVPGLYSMIDIGICDVRNLDNTFSASLLELPNAAWSPGAGSFWNRNAHNRRVLAQIQGRAQPIERVMHDMRTYLSQFARPVFVGFPAGFDFAFVHWYWWYVYDTEPPFGHSCLDGKTAAMIAMKCGYREAGKRKLRKSNVAFNPDLPHTHLGVDDAREQAHMFARVMELL